jgi:hypothetical protein
MPCQADITQIHGLLFLIDKQSNSLEPQKKWTLEGVGCLIFRVYCAEEPMIFVRCINSRWMDSASIVRFIAIIQFILHCSEIHSKLIQHSEWIRLSQTKSHPIRRAWNFRGITKEINIEERKEDIICRSILAGDLSPGYQISLTWISRWFLWKGFAPGEYTNCEMADGVCKSLRNCTQTGERDPWLGYSAKHLRSEFLLLKDTGWVRYARSHWDKELRCVVGVKLNLSFNWRTSPASLLNLDESFRVLRQSRSQWHIQSCQIIKRYVKWGIGSIRCQVVIFHSEVCAMVQKSQQNNGKRPFCSSRTAWCHLLCRKIETLGATSFLDSIPRVVLNNLQLVTWKYPAIR